MMRKILLVEDNELNRDMLSRRLQRSGFCVVAAADGREGVRMSREQRPDLVLMDVALGDMDGWEATLAIKADPRSSAHALESARRRSVEVGCADFDTKPVDYARLLAKIEKALIRALDDARLKEVG